MSVLRVTLIVTVIVTVIIVTMLIMSVWSVTKMLVMPIRSTSIVANIKVSRNLPERVLRVKPFIHRHMSLWFLSGSQL